jgi:hypothetical protein
MKDEKPKRGVLIDEVVNRLKAQIEGLGLLDENGEKNSEAAALLAKQNADRLKRKLLLEMLKRQLDEVS